MKYIEKSIINTERLKVVYWNAAWFWKPRTDKTRGSRVIYWGPFIAYMTRT